MIAAITGALITVLGAIILYQGVQLAVVGGSLFYIVMALGMLISGVLLVRRNRKGLAVYGVLLVLTLIWIIAEVGFDKWLWIPRGALLAVFGLWLCFPFVARGLRSANEEKPALWQGAHKFLSSVVGILIIITIGLCFYDPYTKSGELALDSSAPTDTKVGAGDDWTAYGGTNLGQRYSNLKDIDVANIGKLKLAWEYHTGDLRNDKTDAKEYTFEATPLKVNNMLYFCTPHNDIVALDPVTGTEKWRYSPAVAPSKYTQHQTCRGVGYHEDAADTAPTNDQQAAASTTQPAICSKRVIATTTDGRLMALDANTGKPCADFGDNGFVDLKANQPNIRQSNYMETAAPLVTSKLIIIGASIADNAYLHNPSGVTRAFDVHTGKVVWKFDVGAPEDTKPLAPGQQYIADTPLSWATFSADEKLGLAYIPLGNKSPDELGEDRTPNDEKYGDAVVALDLATGQVKWAFRTSYHDLWDRDNPSQPSLLDLPKDGQQVPAIVIPTKGGNVFVLDRRDGQPIIPVHEVQVSTESDVPGEKPSPVQPVSALNFTPPPLKESSMWGITPFDQLECRIEFKKRRYDGNPFTPPSLKGSITFPGNIGVFNWGSVAVDPVHGWMIGTPQRLAYKYDVVKRPDLTSHVFSDNGNPESNDNIGGEYAVKLSHMRSSLGIPCNPPSWGDMVGVDLKTGKTAWLYRDGTTKDQKILGVTSPFPFPMGILAHGGTLVTAGGVSFTAATLDNYLRAYNVRTGEKVWQARLPAGGQATPMTYRGADGKQYIVIAAGGHGSIGTTPGDSVLAYTIEK